MDKDLCVIEYRSHLDIGIDHFFGTDFATSTRFFQFMVALVCVKFRLLVGIVNIVIVTLQLALKLSATLS